MDKNIIKANIDLREYIRADWRDPKNISSGEHQFECPFHNDDKTPSLTVWRDHYHCFGCTEHGDIFAWIMKRKNCRFSDAIRIAGGDYVDTGAHKKTCRDRPQLKMKTQPVVDWQTSAANIITECYVRLWSEESSAMARRWLLKRGLDANACRQRFIGLNDHDNKKHGLYVQKGIIIPHLVGSDIWAIKVRQSREPKYIHVKGSVPALYGVETLGGRRIAFICEGEFDAILLHQLVGDLAGVASFGAASIRGDDMLNTWIDYLVDLERLYIATDNDEAGEQAWRWWAEVTRRARRAAPPGNCKDVTDAYLAGHDLRAWAKEVLT